LLASDGRLSVILPVFREQDFLELSKGHQFHLLETRKVHSFAEQRPAFVLITVGKTMATIKKHRPLVIYQKPGEYTAEMKKQLYKSL
jgi:tRNA1(Val) A37 N6-methylase TrmN6